LRLRDIADAHADLDDPRHSPAVPNVKSGRTRGTRIAARALAAIAVTAAAAAVWWRGPGGRAPAPEHVARFTLTLQAPDFFALDAPSMAFSPDGSSLVYAERDATGAKLYIRGIDEFNGRPIPGSEGTGSIVVSPDGEWIGFFAGRTLKKIALRGGTAIEICTVASPPLGATWLGDAIVLGSVNGSGLLRVRAEPSSTATPLDGAAAGAEAWPESLPDGSILFTVPPTGGKPAFLAVASTATGKRTVLLEGSAGHYLSTGHLVFVRGNSLMAVRFDLATLALVGAPTAVIDNVQVLERSGAAQVAVSTTGNLAFVSRRTFSARQLVLVDRHGQTRPLVDEERPFTNPRVSPDGSRIVVDITSSAGPDVWVYDIGRAVWLQLTFNGLGNAPIWTPDGRSITYVAVVNGGPKLFRKPADGSGPAELLSDRPGNPHSWSPDGRWLARTTARDGGGVGLALLAMDATHTARPFPATPDGPEMAAPAISPDGRWIAYVTTDSGRRQVYVRRFPEGEGRWLVSPDGGTQPMWARSGRELFLSGRRPHDGGRHHHGTGIQGGPSTTPV
jgi:serine/threonine-protein kinase